MVVIANESETKEIVFEGMGTIKGCRVNNKGKIEFKVLFNNQKIWVPASVVHELPKEEDFNGGKHC